MTKPRLLNTKQNSRVKDVFGKTKKSPFIWGVPQYIDNKLVEYIQAEHLATEKNLSLDDCQALECESEWQSLLVKLTQNAYFPDASDSTPQPTKPRELSLAFQLAYIEYPLWCIIHGCQTNSELKTLVNQLENFVGDSLDVDGWPLGKLAGEFSLYIASWCRCQKLVESLGYQLTPDTISQLEGMTLQIARMNRGKGGLMFADNHAGIHCNAFKKAIDELWTTDGQVSPFCLGSPTSRQRLPAASSLSEWGQIGVLRSGWRAKDSKLGVRFNGEQVHLELASRFPLVGGECTPSLRIDGKEQSVNSEIGVACFHRFAAGEYLELEIEFDKATVARQILLLTDDQLLYLNDVVSCKEKGVLEYDCSYPLTRDLEVVKEIENNEIYFRHGQYYSLVLPLFLPEWKSARTSAHWAIEDQKVKVSNKANGLGLSTPLAVDLNSRRSVKPRTWRQLTVAESMETVAADVAAAYRIQIGNDQWLFYRSIGECGNRTFLGQNFADDFFVGKIDLEGNVETLLEIE